MSLLDAHQKLLAAGRPGQSLLTSSPPAGAIGELVRFVEAGGALESAHPWELSPAACRAVEEAAGFTPPGGWSRLAGLAAGTEVFEATNKGFVSHVPSAAVGPLLGDGRRRLVEAFTVQLIPPAAAAALYVSLDVHPLWGLELGRFVGATELSAGIASRSPGALMHVCELVFGTLTGLVTSMRCLSADRRYPTDQLGDVLWWSAQSARSLSAADDVRHAGLPIFLGDATAERRMLTTRLAITDLLDFVFVPAGIARRDDSGGFTIDAEGLADVSVGPWDLEQQIAWWNEALVIPQRAAC